MSPTLMENHLLKRYYCDIYDCSSNWYDWGRWVALGVIVGCAILLAFLFSCITNRRRRAHGLPPMYGTGWMAGKPPAGQQNGNVHYYPNQPYYAAPMPAPPYSPPVAYQQTGNTFNSNDGYYGAPYAHGGIELQPPQNVYSPQRGGDPVYSPPPGPPPGKEGQGATFR